jgi:hypothetical protein
MTAPQFTPGPWHVVGRAEEYNLAVCAPRPGNEDRLDSVLGDEHAEANARLIAAAPELYEVVDHLVNGTADIDTIYEDAREALAKARGES